MSLQEQGNKLIQQFIGCSNTFNKMRVIVLSKYGGVWLQSFAKQTLIDGVQIKRQTHYMTTYTQMTSTKIQRRCGSIDSKYGNKELYICLSCYKTYFLSLQKKIKPYLQKKKYEDDLRYRKQARQRQEQNQHKRKQAQYQQSLKSPQQKQKELQQRLVQERRKRRKLFFQDIKDVFQLIIDKLCREGNWKISFLILFALACFGMAIYVFCQI